MNGDEKPIGVAVLGLGNVGSEVVRIIEEQRQRPDRPHRGPARAARHRGAPGGRRPWRAGRAAHRQRRRAGVPRRRRHRRRTDGAGRTRAQGDSQRARTGQVRRHRQQGADGGSPRANWRRPPNMPTSTSTSRPPWPARSPSSARSPSRWRATRCCGWPESSTAPPITSFRRWTAPEPTTLRPWPTPARWAMRRPTRPPMSRGTTRRPRPRSWRRSRSTPG